MARPIELGIIVYQVVPKILGVIVGIGRRSNISYIGINPIAASSIRYYVYAADPS